ncbi:cytochrome P450 [Aspergillus eucalypticola CBS 122712]|uniref:Cytochrome P450 n=1 Tax=Aspergillus eucalypticola (strain CBS 122712 / IBT 29274) TaxID=1448314 RepID=A0A317V520_ASPEC|nr:cytochrome P450 [Aspergillus eucalypticola CBS 122712]PWY68371.1 cytochrome P450 [Aspergillus eucalypticola CBS 122712]
MASINIILTICLPFLSLAAYGLRALYQHRSKINRLRKQGVRMPAGWSWLTGHLLVLSDYVNRLPEDANVVLATQELASEHTDTEIFLLDVWPMSPAQYIVFYPEAASQATNKLNLAKAVIQPRFMQPITGGPSMISMGNAEWKVWRSIFNPGFSAGSMQDLLPEVIKSVGVFCEKLHEKANAGKFFALDDLTTRLTMDVILKVTLDADLDHQHSDNIIATALGHITKWHSFWDPRVRAHPLRPLVQGYYGRVVNKCIRKALNERFSEMKQTKRDVSSRSKRAKSILTLALEAYLENKNEEITEATQLDDRFAEYVTYQIRLFLFAGTDTTSSSIAYVYHLLSKHPEALARVRQEHDHIFGPDPSAAALQLREQPSLLNQCSYTMAVIKETLRLYSPAGTMRQGANGLSLADRHGYQYPLADDFCVVILHQATHLNPRVWPRAREFIPDRWLVEPGHELYPDPAAYRPFEQGPRNCIGQTLVYNEMRTVLVMTARTFDIKPAYDELDAMKAKQRGWFDHIAESVGFQNKRPKLQHGERAYQSEKAGTHPVDGYPCRVTLVTQIQQSQRINFPCTRNGDSLGPFLKSCSISHTQPHY